MSGDDYNVAIIALSRDARIPVSTIPIHLSGAYSVRRRLEAEKLLKNVDTLGRTRVVCQDVLSVVQEVFNKSASLAYDQMNTLQNRVGQSNMVEIQRLMMGLTNWNNMLTVKNVEAVDGFDVAKKIILNRDISTIEWKFNARMSFLVSEDFDVENVPAWEQQLHFGTLYDHVADLRRMFTLFIRALLTASGQAVAAHVIDESVDNRYEEMSRLHRVSEPFGVDTHVSGGNVAVSRFSEWIDRLESEAYVTLVATPDARVAAGAPLFDFECENRTGFYWCCGASSTMISESLALVLQYLNRQAEGDFLNIFKRGFVGWHYSRPVEPRQTAHAILFGEYATEFATRFEECNLEGVGENDKASPLVVVKGGLCDLYKCRELLDRGIVEQPVVFVKGPGVHAVTTKCTAINCFVPTSKFKLLESEIMGHIRRHLKDPPYDMVSTCVAAGLGVDADRSKRARTVGMFLPRTIDDLFKKGATTIGVLRVLIEADVVDSVRADGGKRYKHRLPVEASVDGLRRAISDMLFY